MRAFHCTVSACFRSSKDQADISKMSDAAPYHWNDNRRDRGSGSEDRCETSLISSLYFNCPKSSFSETLIKPKEFENAGFSFSCGRKCILKTELFQNDASNVNHVVSLTSKMTADGRVFQFPWCSLDEKHLMYFQSETSVFKLLRRRVDDSLLRSRY